MALPLPASLTPSKVSTFKDCALAFRFSVIEGLAEPPSEQAFKGTVVHRALQLLMWEETRGQRSLPRALEKLDRAFEQLAAGPEGQALGLEGERREQFMEDARHLVRNYFALEDPNSVRVIGTELLMQTDISALPAWRSRGAGAEPALPAGPEGHLAAPACTASAGTGTAPAVAKWAADRAPGRPVPLSGSVVLLRGIIDRLELDADGELVVTDYKTGRAPGAAQEQARLGGVHFYAFLCEKVLGRRPARVQLLHLREPLVVSTTPSEQSIAGLELQAVAMWEAITKACLFEDFRPKPGLVCERCAFHAYCPAQGGDISLARDASLARRASQAHGTALGGSAQTGGTAQAPAAAHQLVLL